jgi:K+-transporting ATPase ATPase C chain
MLKKLKPVLVCYLLLTLICGIIYPVIVTSIAQMAFPYQANGSIITVSKDNEEKRMIGSALIGQEFTKPEYLIGRPLGVSQLSPVGQEQKDRIQERINWWHDFDPQNKAAIPMDLVTTSGSGVDPNISVAAAEYQIKRIAEARNLPEASVAEIIRTYTTGRFLGIWGEPSVNVLKVNLALDGLIQ